MIPADPADSNLPAAEQEGLFHQPTGNKSKRNAGKKCCLKEDPQGRMPGQMTAETPPDNHNTQHKTDDVP